MSSVVSARPPRVGLSTEEVVAELRRRSSFVFVSHVKPDGDTLGAGLALGLALKALGKRVGYFQQDPVPRNLRFLPDAEFVTRDVPADLPADTLWVFCDMSDLTRAGEFLPEDRAREHARHRPPPGQLALRRAQLRHPDRGLDRDVRAAAAARARRADHAGDRDLHPDHDHDRHRRVHAHEHDGRRAAHVGRDDRAGRRQAADHRGDLRQQAVRGDQAARAWRSSARRCRTTAATAGPTSTRRCSTRAAPTARTPRRSCSTCARSRASRSAALFKDYEGAVRVSLRSQRQDQRAGRGRGARRRRALHGLGPDLSRARPAQARSTACTPRSRAQGL